ncbi:hypothetical protein K2Z83_11785 [Oscillochloris sp. ZM17-4]|uniref:hypothetical protein n=1 Tax=Oscillochloris sp. ZM17-4 TaxID=2866714 RepID=UPI001C73240F|nr:hypothetical protein [Oscillochloris sp. ZM17-4]MBX0328357.1 hypothetical protein [Oscillochloris sp. ZM17-4]
MVRAHTPWGKPHRLATDVAPERIRSPFVVVVLASATPAPRPVVMRAAPTAPPCTIRELGAVLRICNGIVP